MAGVDDGNSCAGFAVASDDTDRDCNASSVALSATIDVGANSAAASEGVIKVTPDCDLDNVRIKLSPGVVLGDRTAASPPALLGTRFNMFKMDEPVFTWRCCGLLPPEAAGLAVGLDPSPAPYLL